MTAALVPRDAADVADLVASAVARKTPLEVIGHASKRGFGRPVEGAVAVDLSGLSGITLYEPDELVLRAAAGTPIAYVLTVLNQSRQQFAFEPPDLGPFYGGEPDRGTLAGMVACNLAGPRRICAGAARDHFLGFRAVNGRAEPFHSGSRVVKNVTGYDLPKLLAGSLGTLAIMTEVTFKVLPRAEKTRTVLVFGLDDEAARRAMSAGLGSSHEVSGAAHLPVDAARLIAVDWVAGAGRPVTCIRVEGPGPSVAARCAALREELAGFGPTEELHSERSVALWRGLRDLAPFVARPELEVWRVSVAPTAGPAIAAEAAPALHWYDWGGGQVWLGFPADWTARGPALRAAIRAAGGGHATLMRAADPRRTAEDVFGPQPAPLVALSRRVKASFDPTGIFNPGRMIQGL